MPGTAGINSSKEYLLNLLDQADIVVLTEHWLWPYSLHELNSLHLDITSAAVTDDRFNFNSDLT